MDRWDYTEGHRGIGRSTRMLKEVAKQIKSTGPCAIVCKHHGHVQIMRQHLSRLSVEETSGSLTKFHFYTLSDKRVHFAKTLLEVDGYPKSNVFIDHHTVECVFGYVINLYHEYD